MKWQDQKRLSILLHEMHGLILGSGHALIVSSRIVANRAVREGIGETRARKRGGENPLPLSLTYSINPLAMLTSGTS